MYLFLHIDVGFIDIFQMFMEAVIKSLKDLEMRHPHAEDHGTALPESSKKDNQDASSTAEHSSKKENEDASSTAVHNGPIGTDPVPDTGTDRHVDACSSTEQCGSSKSQPTPATSDQNSVADQPSPDTSVASVELAFDTPKSFIGSESTGTTSANSDGSGSMSFQSSSSDADLAGNTKATVTVVKNPANHIMDGLMRRWDFNFFRNNR